MTIRTIAPGYMVAFMVALSAAAAGCADGDAPGEVQQDIATTLPSGVGGGGGAVSAGGDPNAAQVPAMEEHNAVNSVGGSDYGRAGDREGTSAGGGSTVDVTTGVSGSGDAPLGGGAPSSPEQASGSPQVGSENGGGTGSTGP
jgi:hypothetical protein